MRIYDGAPLEVSSPAALCAYMITECCSKCCITGGLLFHGRLAIAAADLFVSYEIEDLQPFYNRHWLCESKMQDAHDSVIAPVSNYGVPTHFDQCRWSLSQHMPERVGKVACWYSGSVLILGEPILTVYLNIGLGKPMSLPGDDLLELAAYH